MQVVRKTVTFTEQQDLWIKSQIESGDFTNDSEYIRHLVRQDQKRESELQYMKKMIQDGISSGISSKSIPDIINEVEDNLKRHGRL